MRTFFYRAGKFTWRFMVIFSFIVNVILLLVLLILGLLIFDIKNNIASPLINGLHSSFVGLDEATIDWTIPVRDQIAISLNVPINANTITSQVNQIGGVPVSPIPGETVVRLTRDVPIRISGANITAPGLTVTGATVNISLPAGTELPVALDLAVSLNTQIPVALDVRAVIPLNQTQLHDVANNLRLVFEPYARALQNLPNNLSEAGQLVSNVLAGKPVDMLADSTYSQNPWPGFSRTAGFGYPFFGEPAPAFNYPIETGIVQIGGIRALDQQLAERRYIYENGGSPEQINAEAASRLSNESIIPAQYYEGDVSGVYIQAQSVNTQQAPAVPPPENGATSAQQESPDTTNSAATGDEQPGIGGPVTPTPSGGDLGILPTPQPGG